MADLEICDKYMSQFILNAVHMRLARFDIMLKLH